MAPVFRGIVSWVRAVYWVRKYNSYRRRTRNWNAMSGNGEWKPVFFSSLLWYVLTTCAAFLIFIVTYRKMKSGKYKTFALSFYFLWFMAGLGAVLKAITQ
jgi:hypothetical protein